ncbi:hypothetical protein D3C80_1691830 [compost metagenome]
MQVDTTSQLGNRHAVARLEEHQRGAFEHRVAGGPGILTYGDHIVLANLAGFQRLADDVAGHHFGQAGRVAACVGVRFRQNFTGVVINQDVGLSINLRHTWDHGFNINVVCVGN